MGLHYLSMRIAIAFDTPWAGWSHEQHLEQLDREIAAQATTEPEVEYQVAHALRSRGHEIVLLGLRNDLAGFLARLAEVQPDVVFNCAESFAGADRLDYVVTAAIESLPLPCVGTGTLGLMLSRDKALSKKVLAYHGIRVPGFATFPLGAEPAPPADLRFPLFVKPLASDASEGIAHASVVQDAEALAARVAFLHQQFGQEVIAEEFVDGREFYVSLLGARDALQVLPLVELVFDKEKNPPEERIATRSAKWDERYRERRGIRNVFARPLAEKSREELERACIGAFHALGLHDYARCDVRVDAAGQVWIIEANANPFIAEGHDFAESAAKAGLAYPALIERLVELALQRRPRAAT